MQTITNYILYEDDSILVVNKPNGLPSQLDQSKDISLLSMAEAYAGISLHIVNRLDRPASGIVMFAKNVKKYNKIQQLWKSTNTRKEYLAIVEGSWDIDTTTLTHRIKKGRGNKAILHNEGKVAILTVEAYPIYDHYSLCRIFLESGRFHQIRFQLSEMGYPIKGDIKYGARRGNRDRSIYLHSYKLTMGDHHFLAPFPQQDSLWKIAGDYYNKSLS